MQRAAGSMNGREICHLDIAPPVAITPLTTNNAVYQMLKTNYLRRRPSGDWDQHAGDDQ